MTWVGALITFTKLQLSIKQEGKRFFLQDLFDDAACKASTRRYILRTLVTFTEESVLAQTVNSKSVLEEILTNEANLVALKQRFTDDSDSALELKTVEE